MREGFREAACILLKSRACEPDENQTMKHVPRRSGPLSRYELFCWHRANGTLGVFFSMFRR